MRSYRFGALTSIEDLHLHQEPMPSPQRGEVLLRVRAVTLNYRDIAIVQGSYPGAAKSGLIPCSDAMAEVVEVGEGVGALRLGDRVVSSFHPRWFGGPLPADYGADCYGSAQDGWLSEFKVVSQEAVVKIPAGISDEVGATLPCAGVTAWNALTGSEPIRAGHTVLTLGTGGVSMFALQLAKAVGARVIATTSDDRKARRLRELGADEVVNYRDKPQWGAVVRDLTDGRGVDRVIEVGGPATISESLKAVAMGGEICLIGYLGLDSSGIDVIDLKTSNASIRSITVGSRSMLQNLVRTVEECRIRPTIDRIFDFPDAKASFEHLASGKHVGQIVVRVAE